jgi:hypothetical protein
MGARKATFIYSDYAKRDYFTEQTRLGLFKVFKAHFLIDKKIEKAKKTCTHRPNFNVPDAYHKIDVDERGTITIDSMKRFMQINGFHPTNSELSWIFPRFDRNLKGYITYDEFEMEILPHSKRLVDITYTISKAK